MVGSCDKTKENWMITEPRRYRMAAYRIEPVIGGALPDQESKGLRGTAANGPDDNGGACLNLCG